MLAGFGLIQTVDRLTGNGEIEANATDYEALSRLFEEKSAAEAELEAVYEEWCRLTDEA